jgi:hypothetical protein
MDIICKVCGRKRLFLGEGRFIDNSWLDDEKLSQEYKNSWVCSYRCYERIKGQNNTEYKHR